LGGPSADDQPQNDWVLLPLELIEGLPHYTSVSLYWLALLYWEWRSKTPMSLWQALSLRPRLVSSLDIQTHHPSTLAEVVSVEPTPVRQGTHRTGLVRRHDNSGTSMTSPCDNSIAPQGYEKASE
jgi:hypothetical protein